MITVEKTDSSIHVTIPISDIPPGRFNSFLDWLRLEGIVRRSTLSEEEAGRLADEIKTGWWAANKHLFIKSPGA